MGDEHAAPAGKGRVPHILAPAPNIGWFKHRAAELGTSLSAISATVFGYRFLLARSLKGTRELRAKELPGLAKAFSVSLPVLLQHLGYDLKEQTGETLLVDRSSRHRDRVDAITARYISEAKQLLERYERRLNGEQ